MRNAFSFSKLGRFCRKALVAFLVLFALTVSLIRGLLPHLDNARQELIAFVDSQYRIKAEAGEISARWRAFGPVVTIDNLNLPEQSRLPVALNLRQVQFKIDFWRTLLTLSPRVENVTVDGVKLELDLDKLTSSSSAAVTRSAGDATQALDWLYRLLLAQLKQYSLSNIEIKLNSRHHDYKPLLLNNFYWRNRGGLHQGQGQLMLDNSKASREYLELKFKLTGDGHDPDTLKGRAYAAANSLDLGLWSARHKAMNKDVNAPHIQGVVNLRAWADFSNRNWQSALVSFSPSRMQWSLDNHQQKFEINKGMLSWRRFGSGEWQVRSRDFELISNGKPWGDFYISADYSGGRFRAALCELNVGLLEPLLPLYPLLDEHTLSQWHSLSPSGHIGPVKLRYAGADGLSISSGISRLAWKAFSGIPGSGAVNADIELRNDKLTAELPGQNYRLDFGNLFVKPLHFAGEPIRVSFDFSRRRLSVPRLRLSNADLGINASASLDFNQKVSMALAAELRISDVTQAHLYFPVKAMGHDLSNYLASALKAGEIPRANLVWNGNFADFPYQGREGIFQAGFNIQKGRFRFRPDWPAVTELNLDALFQNERMDLRVNKGNLAQVKADGAHVFIPSLDAGAELGVRADLHTEAEDATEVLQSSALSDSAGEVLKAVQVHGPVKGKLDLTIPLYEGGKASVRGQVELNNNDVYVSNPGIDLAQVTGGVRFHNDVIEGDNIMARLFDQPLQVSFDSGSTRSGGRLSAALSGQWDLDRLPAALNNPLRTYYHGHADWWGKLKIVFNDGGYSLQADVQSDLLGTGLDLPDGFSKTPEQKRKLQAELISDNTNAALGIRLGDQFEFRGRFDPFTDKRLRSYSIMIGRLFRPGDQLRARNGQLNMDAGHARLSDWLPILERFSKGAAQSEPSSDNSRSPEADFFPPLTHLAVSAGELDVFGQPLKQLSVSGRKADNTWRLEADSDAFKGEIDFYPDWERQGIKITADKLHLFSRGSPAGSGERTRRAGSGQADIPGINTRVNADVLKTLPPVALTAKDFSFMGYKLGSLSLNGSKADRDYHLDNLRLSAPEIRITGSGTWFAKDKSDTGATELNFSIQADNFDALAGPMKIDPGIRDSGLSGQLKLRWQGAPYDFHISRLNGNVHFELEKGHLSQVSDQGARIFSLFSLDSLLRKLSFDFSDVFGEGLYYNTFEGDLRIDDGVVKTTDTNMDAVAGTVKVRGYTDLMKQNLNYDIRFSPKLASSVPTVVLLSTSAWTLGIGAFALTKVLEPVIEVISEIRFRLTGTMSKPVIEELERKSKEIEIPEAVLEKAYPEALKKKQAPEKAVQDKRGGKKKAFEIQSGRTEPNTTPVKTPQDNTVYLRNSSDANQSTAVPERHGCSAESGRYPLAA